MVYDRSELWVLMEAGSDCFLWRSERRRVEDGAWKGGGREEETDRHTQR